MKVLFVQNKPAMATALQLTFIKQGFEVIFTPNSTDAIECIFKHRPKLVILDIMTPTSGVEFVSALKKYNIPVIVLTALGDEVQLQKAFDLGADDYMNQPYSMAELSLRANLLVKAKAIA